MQAAKDALHIFYAHTSHGSQVTTGMSGLVAFANGGGKGLSLPTNFLAYNDGGTGGALDLDDHYGNMGDVGYYPAWVNHTRTYLDDAANADVNVVMWSWCGQVDSKWAAGTLESEYLEPMAQLEEDYPNVHFVYMTGHVDHWDDANNKAANQAIRDFCAAEDKILYDFADIESYDPDGVYYEFPNDNCDYYESASGAKLGNWATAWQTSHTQDVDWYSCSSAHSQPLNANQKAYAAWSLFSQIAALPELPDMTDLDGNPRVIDGDSDGTAVVDPGAYEWNGDPVDELYLDGTENADTIVVAISAAEVTVTLNGVATAYNPAEYSTIHFDGLGGADTITIVGSNADEQVAMRVGTVDMESETFAFHATNVETINVDAAGGADQVTMTGSADACRLYSYPDRATFADSPRTFRFRAEGFETVAVDAPARDVTTPSFTTPTASTPSMPIPTRSSSPGKQERPTKRQPPSPDSSPSMPTPPWATAMRRPSEVPNPAGTGSTATPIAVSSPNRPAASTSTPGASTAWSPSRPTRPSPTPTSTTVPATTG